MGHFANYQTERYIKRLEQIFQGLVQQGATLEASGLNGLAKAVFDQVDQLSEAITDLRKALEN